MKILNSIFHRARGIIRSVFRGAHAPPRANEGAHTRALSIIGAALLAFSLQPSAEAQSLTNISGLPASVSSQSSSNNISSTPIQLHFGQGLNLFVPFSTGLGPSTNVVYWLALSPDNITWSTTNDLPFAMYSNNNSNVVHTTNFTSIQLANAQYAKIRTIAWNGTNTFFPSNVLASITDSGQNGVAPH